MQTYAICAHHRKHKKKQIHSVFKTLNSERNKFSKSEWMWKGEGSLMS